MKDYRLKENRREAFIKWMIWSIIHEDCDSALFMTNYLFDRFEVNLEQKYWFSWIYGTTYHLPTAWVIFSEFPDFELVDQQRIEKWNDENYHRLRYQTDTRYNKGKLPKQFASYKSWVHDLNNAENQREAFQKISSDDPVQTFWNIYHSFNKHVYRFGRVSLWYYLQMLKHCVGMNVQPGDLRLNEFGEFGGSRSQRNGLIMALGLDEWYDQELTTEQVKTLEIEALSLLKEVEERIPEEYRQKVDLFSLETCLCSFKKIFREKNGRYLGYYLDRQGEEISQVEQDNWNGICWQPLWDARQEIIGIPELLKSKIQTDRMSSFIQTGSIDRLNFLWEEEQKTEIPYSLDTFMEN